MDYEKKIHDLLYVSEVTATFKAVAAILNISYNEAKKVLEEYVRKVLKNDVKTVTYVLGGITCKGDHKVIYVSGSKYAKAKEKFTKILIDHIYSVQMVPVDWQLHKIVDEFWLSEEKTSPKKVKDEPSEAIVEEEPTTNTRPVKNIKQKGSISNFFTQNNPIMKSFNKVKVKKETSPPPSDVNSKETAKDVLPVNTIKVEPMDSNSEIDDTEMITETKRKRARVISDDEEDEVTKKCQKLDILDSDHENSSSDIFGNPEEPEEESPATEENTPEIKETVTVSSTSEKESQNSEISDNMFEDDDGFIVTQRKPVAAKKKLEKLEEPVKENKQPTIQEKKVAPKEATSKRKKVNPNQKTILSFFNKK